MAWIWVPQNRRDKLGFLLPNPCPSPALAAERKEPTTRFSPEVLICSLLSEPGMHLCCSVWGPPPPHLPPLTQVLDYHPQIPGKGTGETCLNNGAGIHTQAGRIQSPRALNPSELCQVPQIAPGLGPGHGPFPRTSPGPECSPRGSVLPFLTPIALGIIQTQPGIWSLHNMALACSHRHCSPTLLLAQWAACSLLGMPAYFSPPRRPLLRSCSSLLVLSVPSSEVTSSREPSQRLVECFLRVPANGRGCASLLSSPPAWKLRDHWDQEPGPGSRARPVPSSWCRFRPEFWPTAETRGHCSQKPR